MKRGMCAQDKEGIMGKVTQNNDAIQKMPQAWAFGPSANEAWGRKALHESDEQKYGNIQGHMLARVEICSSLSDELAITLLDAKRNGLVRAASYLGYRLVHLARVATSLLSLIASVALTTLTLPLYPTIVNRYLRICVLNSAEHLKDCALKLPIVFEIQWVIQASKEKEV